MSVLPYLLSMSSISMFSTVRLYVKLVVRQDWILLKDYAFFVIAWATTALIIVGVLTWACSPTMAKTIISVT